MGALAPFPSWPAAGLSPVAWQLEAALILTAGSLLLWPMRRLPVAEPASEVQHRRSRVLAPGLVQTAAVLLSTGVALPVGMVEPGPGRAESRSTLSSASLIADGAIPPPFPRPLFQHNRMKNELIRAEIDRAIGAEFPGRHRRMIDDHSGEYFDLFEDAYEQVIARDVITDLERAQRALNMQDNLALARQTTDTTIDRYREGLVALVDVLQTIQRECQTARNLLDAYLGYRNSLLRLHEMTFNDFLADMAVLERYKLPTSIREVMEE